MRYSVGKAILAVWRTQALKAVKSHPSLGFARANGTYSQVTVINVAVVICILVGASNLLGVILQVPVVGYANNYDFVRIEACLGIWPVYDGVPTDPDEAANGPKGWHPVPVQYYAYTKALLPTHCAPTADLVFVKIATLFRDERGLVDIRVVGLVRAALIFVIIAAAILLTDRLACRLQIAILFFLIFGDIAYISYFNTLYTEYAVIAGLFFIVSGICTIGSGRPRFSALLIVFLGIALLSCSKVQYCYLASALSLLVSLILFGAHRNYAGAVIFLLLAALGPGFFDFYSGRNFPVAAIMDWANRTDTYLQAVLPEAQDARSAVRRLGLPEHCTEEIGKGWFSPGERRPCPEVANVSRARLLALFAAEPRTLILPLWKSVALSRPWYLSYGRVELPEAKETAFYKWATAVSFSGLIDRLPLNIYGLVVVVSIVLGAAAGIAISLRALRHVGDLWTTGYVQMSLFVGGALSFYSLFSSVFGSGYTEVAKHAVGLPIGIFVQLSAVVTFGIIRLANHKWGCYRGR